MFEWLWVVTGSFLLAGITILDGKYWGPYFAYSEIILGFPEIQAKGQSEGARLLMLRRAAYPTIAGFVLSLAFSRPADEAVAIGALSTLLLIWPVVMHGLPPVNTSRHVLIILYISLVVIASALGWLGWIFGESFDGPRAVLSYLREQAVSAIVLVLVGAFGRSASLSMIRKSSNDE